MEPGTHRTCPCASSDWCALTLLCFAQLRKKAIQDEKIEQLQRAVSQLQLAAAKREAVEQRLRTKLEEEIRNLRERHSVRTGFFFLQLSGFVVSFFNTSVSACQYLARERNCLVFCRSLRVKCRTRTKASRPTASRTRDSSSTRASCSSCGRRTSTSWRWSQTRSSGSSATSRKWRCATSPLMPYPCRSAFLLSTACCLCQTGASVVV